MTDRRPANRCRRRSRDERTAQHRVAAHVRAAVAADTTCERASRYSRARTVSPRRWCKPASAVRAAAPPRHSRRHEHVTARGAGVRQRGPDRQGQGPLHPEAWQHGSRRVRAAQLWPTPTSDRRADLLRRPRPPESELGELTDCQSLLSAPRARSRSGRQRSTVTFSGSTLTLRFRMSDLDGGADSSLGVVSQTRLEKLGARGCSVSHEHLD